MAALRQLINMLLHSTALTVSAAHFPVQLLDGSPILYSCMFVVHIPQACNWGRHSLPPPGGRPQKPYPRSCVQSQETIWVAAQLFPRISDLHPGVHLLAPPLEMSFKTSCTSCPVTAGFGTHGIRLLHPKSTAPAHHLDTAISCRAAAGFGATQAFMVSLFCIAPTPSTSCTPPETCHPLGRRAARH